MGDDEEQGDGGQGCSDGGPDLAGPHLAKGRAPIRVVRVAMGGHGHNALRKCTTGRPSSNPSAR